MVGYDRVYPELLDLYEGVRKERKGGMLSKKSNWCEVFGRHAFRECERAEHGVFAS